MGDETTAPVLVEALAETARLLEINQAELQGTLAEAARLAQVNRSLYARFRENVQRIMETGGPPPRALYRAPRPVAKLHVAATTTVTPAPVTPQVTIPGVNRLLTPNQAAAISGWALGSATGVSPRWIYNNWRQLPDGVARKISHRKLRLVEDAWKRWLQSGGPDP